MRGWWLALAACLACDGIGAPIVAERPSGQPQLFACAQPTLDCTTPAPAQAPFARPTPVSVPSCGAPLALRVVEAIPVNLPEQTCASLDLTPAPGSDRGELSRLVARESRLRLHAEQPTTFLFSQVVLERVAIELEGPIALELTGDLRHVSITSADAVQVTLTGADAGQLAVDLPQGSLRIQRSRMSGSQLAAREVELETVPFAELDVTAERMIGIELRGAQLRLDVDDLSLSEAEVTALELHRCETALLVNTRLNQALLAGCKERLRAHSSAISNGRAFGTIESVGSYWSRTHFGAGATTLELWLGTVTASVFCPNLARLTLSEATSATCNDCTPLRTPEQQLCRVSGEEVSDTEVGAGNELCPILDQDLPRCDPAPLPSSPL